MSEYRVELDYYSGPLDLLLYLVKRDEIDLHDIPVARLCEQYMEHLERIKKIDIALAGDFLVMAATLVEIKSQMLIPQEQRAVESPEQSRDSLSDLDPRYELVQQLLAYKRFKDAAMELDARREEWEARFAHAPGRPARGNASDDDNENNALPAELEMDDVSVNDLYEAFARILDSIGQTARAHAVTYDDTPIQLHAEDILDRLRRDGQSGRMTLQQIFVGRTNKSEMIGLFLATLELVRQKRVRVMQDKAAGEIAIEIRPDHEHLRAEDDKAADWRDPQTGQVQYDWPSEEDRKRAQRRAKLRASYAAKGHFGEPTEEELLAAELELQDTPPESSEVEAENSDPPPTGQ